MPTTTAPSRAKARRYFYCALLLCALTVTAAVVSFAKGNLLGIAWILLGGLSSNIAWYYWRRSRSA